MYLLKGVKKGEAFGCHIVSVSLCDDKAFCLLGGKEQIIFSYTVSACVR